MIRPGREMRLLMALLLAGTLGVSSVSHASLSNVSPLAAPTIETCRFVPNPSANVSFECGDANALSAFVNISVFFQVNVSDSTDNNMSVTFYFDYWIPDPPNPPAVNPASPVRTINVSSPGGGQPVSVNTTWTYASPNANFSGGQYYVYVEVRNDAGEFDPNLGTWLFPVFVSINSPPFIDGLLSLNAVSQSIRFQNPIIPLVYENVTVGDADSDPVTLTWDWGDGTRTVNTTDPLFDSLALSVTHRYAASFFPLNETPRYVDILVRVWVDDGLGHNVSGNSTTEFYLEFDAPPSVRIDRPGIASVWKVGEPVTMVGNATDLEGDPVTAYWDFDNRTDSTGVGDPTRNQDASGTTATHAYSAPGTYNISFWATDGEKQLCLEPTCADFTTHWRSAVQPIVLRDNQAPVLALTNASAIVGEPILLRASVYDPDGDSMTVRWVFGDGTPDATNVTGTSPRTAPQVFEVFQGHAYTSVGNHTLTLYVFDGNETVNDARTVVVQSFNLPPVLGQAFLYRANGMRALDGTFAVNTTVVVKTSTYDPENDTLSVSIDWADGTADDLTIDPKTSADCVLDTLSRKICSVSFSHVYANLGLDPSRSYTIVLTLTDSQVYFIQNVSGGPPITRDHTMTGGVNVVVLNSGPVILPLSLSIAASTTNGTLPLTVSFSVTVSGGVPPYTYSWDLGDGNRSSQPNPSHVYRIAGTFTVKVTVTDSGGRNLTRTTTVTANAEPITGAPSGIPSWAYYLIGVVIVVAVVSLVALRVWRGRRQPPQIGPPPSP